ncbi:MAG: helix-turn-helix transcriptional regulator [Chloroflexota bacterium]
MSQRWGTRLKAFRQKTGLSQSEFADEVSALFAKCDQDDLDALEDLGIKHLAFANYEMSRYENNRRTPRFRSRYISLIWSLHQLGGIVTSAEANSWLADADQAPLTVKEERTIFGGKEGETLSTEAQQVSFVSTTQNPSPKMETAHLLTIGLGSFFIGIIVLASVLIFSDRSVLQWGEAESGIEEPASAIVSANLEDAPATSMPDERPATHQNAYAYAYWSFESESGLYHVDQQVTVSQKGPASYWGMSWYWAEAEYGGFMGLQTDGNHFDGTTGELAIFSLWNGDVAVGPSCNAFEEQGGGQSCRLPFEIDEGETYTYRIWRLDSDDEGQWWGAWILADGGSRETHIGNIRVPFENAQIRSVSSFGSYFGVAVPCDEVPSSSVDFDPPTGNSNQINSSMLQTTIGDCSGGRVEAQGSAEKAVTIRIGR